MSEPKESKTEKQRQLDNLNDAAEGVAENAAKRIRELHEDIVTTKVDHVQPSLAATVILHLLKKVSTSPYESHGIARNVASRSDTDKGLL